MTTSLLAVVFCLQLVADGAPASAVLVPGEPNVLKMDWRRKLVSVQVMAERERTADALSAPTAPGQFPDTVLVVKRIAITVGRAELYVPRSAYADLVWVREAKLLRDSAGLRLIIIGGDASESYRMVLEFTDRAVKKRALFSGEFPERPLQETYYYSQVVN